MRRLAFVALIFIAACRFGCDCAAGGPSACDPDCPYPPPEPGTPCAKRGHVCEYTRYDGDRERFDVRWICGDDRVYHCSPVGDAGGCPSLPDGDVD